MKKTFFDKLQTQIFNQWIVHYDDNNQTYIYCLETPPTSATTYFHSGPFYNDGYFFIHKQGEVFSSDKLKQIKDSRDIKIDTTYLLGCCKLSDLDIKRKLDKFLAKRLLHG